LSVGEATESEIVNVFKNQD